jgi:hypothetical protein
MEARIARIEADVAHLLTGVAEIKTDVRALRERTDTRLDRLEYKFDTKFDSLESKLDTKFESLDIKFDCKFTWALSLGIASVAGILGAMARGFGWL